MIVAMLQTEDTADDAVPTEAAESFGTAIDILSDYSAVFIIAFLVTLLTTPLIRRIAVSKDIIDHPDETRKAHAVPVAYMGGVAVLLGLLAALVFSRFEMGGQIAGYRAIPLSIVAGMIVISVTGLMDDVKGLFPHAKIAGQFAAAAMLAFDDVGVRVAEGLLRPVLGQPDNLLLALGSVQIVSATVYYWVGTAIIAIFVLGGCNAANLLDGLDGLLSGTVAIVAVGLLMICLFLAVKEGAPTVAEGEVGPLAGARIVLCLALLGAVLGFLPHNFNPATIFLGDSGSLLLGFVCVTIILMLGEKGQTHLVFAGLIVFSLPIMDTVLAIVRRRMSGLPMSAADDQHIHHQLVRALGGVKRAVFALYGVSAAFAALGVSLAALVTFSDLRFRAVYAIALVLFGFIGVIAIKAARRQELARQAAALRGRRNGGSERKKQVVKNRPASHSTPDKSDGDAPKPASPPPANTE